MRSPPVPPPRAHLAGTLRLLSIFESLAGAPNPWARQARALLDRPGDLPTDPSDRGLKYDAYLARGPAGAAWGFTINERWEPGALSDLGGRLAADLPDDYAWDRGLALRAALPGMLTLSVGFDHPGRPPRLKLYVQEDRWGEGVADADRVRALIEQVAPGCAIPEWVGGRIPVITLNLRPDGSTDLKIYLGGPNPTEAAEGAPREIRDLARLMGRLCPLGPTWYYLTIRCRPGADFQYAINKIYDHNALGFGPNARPTDAWRDVSALFQVAGRTPALAELLRTVAAAKGLRVLPTATAFEDRGRSVDIYCAAWAIE